MAMTAAQNEGARKFVELHQESVGKLLGALRAATEALTRAEERVCRELMTAEQPADTLLLRVTRIFSSEVAPSMAQVPRELRPVLVRMNSQLASIPFMIHDPAVMAVEAAGENA